MYVATPSAVAERVLEPIHPLPNDRSGGRISFREMLYPSPTTVGFIPVYLPLFCSYPSPLYVGAISRNTDLTRKCPLSRGGGICKFN